MCAQVAPSGEYLRGHGRVAVDVTALRRLWQHFPVLDLVILACVPVCFVLRGSLLCNSENKRRIINYYYLFLCIVSLTSTVDLSCGLRGCKNRAHSVS